MRSPLFLTLPLGGLALAFLSPLLPAQTVGGTEDLKYRFDGLGAGDFLGGPVANVGDVDGDGVPDLIVGALRADPDGLDNAGSVFVFSGATGDPIWRFDGLGAGDMLGGSVAGAGDVDGDGVPDLVVGALQGCLNSPSRAGSAFVFSGATGNQICCFDGQVSEDLLGQSVAGAGDVDLDGRADLIVGAPGVDLNNLFNAGSAIVFSGCTGNPILRFDGQEAKGNLGNSVASAGDVDGDGVPDLIVGAPGENSSSSAGSAFVFSGATGVRLFRFDGQATHDHLGTVAGAGDVDGDGRPDLIVGALLADPNGLPDAGSAFVFTFNPILSASGEVLSVTSGGTIDYAIDFPDVDAGTAYKILVSTRGTGPTTLNGLLIPLTPDNLFRASRNGNTPSVTSGFQGTLDSEGKAMAHVTVPPFALPLKLLGRRSSLHLAVINSKFDFSSVARTLRFTL